MNLKLDYINKSDKIKSQISAGVIGFKFQINGHPFDLNQATDHIINVHLSNSLEYITNIRVNVKDFNSKELMNGIFNFPTSNNIFQSLEPNIYYLEIWVDTKDGRFIFPSENQLKLVLMPNSINGASDFSTISADELRKKTQDWVSLLNHKMQEAQTETKNKSNSTTLTTLSNNDIKQLQDVLKKDEAISQSYFNQLNQNEDLINVKINNNATASDVYYNQNASSINNLRIAVNQLRNEISSLKQKGND